MPPTKAPTFSLHQALDRHPIIVTSTTPLNEVVELMSQGSAYCPTANQLANQPANQPADDEPVAVPPKEHTSCVLVMDADQLVGILTEKDIVRLIASAVRLTERTAADVMAQPVVTLSSEGPLDIFAALNRMRRHHIHHLPVVDAQGQVIGSLTPKRLRSLMEPSDFMRFRLVQEVMNTEVIHARPTDSVLQIVRQLIDHRVSCVVIVTAANDPSSTARLPIGIVTERDIVQMQRLGVELATTPAENVMSAPLFLVSPQDSLWDVDKVMHSHHLRRLVVANEQGELAGIVTQGHLLPVNPVELYAVLELLQDQVSQLEGEKAELLEQRNQSLEKLVEQKASRLQRREQMLRNLALGVGVETGEGFWRSLVSYLTEALQVDYALVGRLEDGQRIRTLAVHGDGQALANVDYDLKGAPCAQVVDQQTCLYQQGVWQQFPQVQMLRDLQIEGYLGVPLQDSNGQVMGLVVVMSRQPMTETDFMAEVLSIFAARASAEMVRQAIETDLRMKVQQQATIAELGQLALSAPDIKTLMDSAVEAIAQTLKIEYCKVLELLADGESMLLKAGVGWQPGLVGDAIIGTEQSSQAGYTLRSEHPVIVRDLRADTRFNGPDLLKDHQVISGMSVIIPGRHRPYGILGAHSTQHRPFSSEDVAFLQSVANVLAQAIERTHSQQILIQSEQEYRTLAKNLPGIVYRVFPEDRWRMDFLNNQCETLTGFSVEALVEGEVCSIDPLIVPDDRPQVIAAVKAGVAHQAPFQVEYRIKDKAGNIRYFWEKGQPVPAKNGNPPYIDGVIFDITERKATQQKIAEQAALLDVATDAILVRDMDGRIRFWNKGAETLYGWTPEEAIGKNANQLLYISSLEGDGFEGYEDIYQSLMRQGRWQGEQKQVTKTGKIVTVMGRWTLVRDEQNQPKFILTVKTDITEAKKLEAQFLRAQRLESVGTLASGIAHDLNNILTPIYGISQLLSMQLPDVDETIKQQFKLLQTSAKRGSEIIKQVLSFSRGEEGDRTPLAVKHLITELRSFAIKTFPKSLEISVDVSNDLWMVNGDATQLYQVLMNLFVNARDAMPSGGQLVLSATNITLDEAFAARYIDAQVGPYIVITVTDTGVGIQADQLDRIFEPFFSTKQAKGGTGLGLSTVHGIVKNHGGFIAVYSEVGKGTQFKVYLPAIESAVDAEAEETPALPMGNGELVLVVDDEGPIGDVAKAILERYHYRVLVAVDGIDAIAQFTEHKADIAIVLMDMTMPNLDGATAIQIIQKMKPEVKVIAVSGLPGNEQVAASLGQSVKAFLPKPYSSAALLNTVKTVLTGE